MNVKIRKCDLPDLDELQRIACQTFDNAFRHLTGPVIMDAYLSTAFDRARLETELKNPDSSFFFLYMDEVLAGYLKVNENEAQTELKDPDSLEIERIYVKEEFQGRGLGKKLILEALEIARQKDKRFVWLGVWEKNEKAIAFYKRMGFKVTGTHDFYMGDDRQTDFIMRKELE